MYSYAILGSYVIHYVSTMHHAGGVVGKSVHRKMCSGDIFSREFCATTQFFLG